MGGLKSRNSRGIQEKKISKRRISKLRLRERGRGYGIHMDLKFVLRLDTWVDAEYSFQSRDLLTSGSNSPTHDAR